MFASISLFGNSENFTPAVDMLNRNAFAGKLAVALFLFLSQLAFFRLLKGSMGIGVELFNTLIARIGELFNIRVNSQTAVFKHIEIVGFTFGVKHRQDY